MKKYDLAKIAASGQCFRMFPVDNKPGVFSIVAFGRYAELTTDPAGEKLHGRNRRTKGRLGGANRVL